MCSHTIKTSAIGLSILAAVATVASYPLNAQSLPNFIDFGQSSQFFNEGYEQIEREIKLLQQDLKLPKIDIPKNSYRAENIRQSNSIYTKARLQPISFQAVIDSQE